MVQEPAVLVAGVLDEEAATAFGGVHRNTHPAAVTIIPSGDILTGTLAGLEADMSLGRMRMSARIYHRTGTMSPAQSWSCRGLSTVNFMRI